MLTSVGGTLKIRNAGLTVPSERGCAGAAPSEKVGGATRDMTFGMVNVVVVVVECWYVVVVRGFYSVVVVLSVVSNQTRALSSPRHSTIHHVVLS